MQRSARNSGHATCQELQLCNCLWPSNDVTLITCEQAASVLCAQLPQLGDCACSYTMNTQTECCVEVCICQSEGRIGPPHSDACMCLSACLSMYCTLLIVMKVIPHNFGRQRPPIIACQSIVENKIRMCDVLSDIEVAQDMLEPKEKEEDRIEMQPNPADEKYASLMADLEVIPAKEEEFKIIESYCKVGSVSVCVRTKHIEHKVVHTTVNTECCLSLQTFAHRCLLSCMLTSNTITRKSACCQC